MMFEKGHAAWHDLIPVLQQRWLILADSFSALQHCGDFLAALAAIAQARLWARGGGGGVGRNYFSEVSHCLVLLHRGNCERLRTKLGTWSTGDRISASGQGIVVGQGQSQRKISHVSTIAPGIRTTFVLENAIHGFRDGRRESKQCFQLFVAILLANALQAVLSLWEPLAAIAVLLLVIVAGIIIVIIASCYIAVKLVRRRQAGSSVSCRRCATCHVGSCFHSARHL